MESNRVFTLDPVPPIVREDRLRTKRRIVAESTLKFRRNMKQSGRRKIELFLPEELATTIGSFQKDTGIRNKTDAFLAIFDGLLEELRRHQVNASREETLQQLVRALAEGTIHEQEGDTVTG